VSSNTLGHDVVVVGASAGGVEPLMRLVAGLPSDLSAAVFVVLHIPADAPSALAAILDRAGPLPASRAWQSQPIERGHIYVAPPNRHMVLRADHIALETGPRENSARPSVDVLFRSAARTFGPRVVGVILSGTLRDGALGLAAIKLRGGVSIIQDPEDALFAGMPESALRVAPVDYRLQAADIPACLATLSQHSLQEVHMQPEQSSQPTIHAADEPDAAFSPKLPNAASGLTCPECNGSLWELEDGESIRYECRVGHAYSMDALLAEQGEAVEAAVWSALNALQERAATFRRLSATPGNPTANAYNERAELTERHAAALLGLWTRLIADGDSG